MIITVTDPTMLAQLLAPQGRPELRAADGRLLGYVSPPPRAPLPPGVEIPYTDEELAEFRKQRSGRPLADILRDLESRE